MEITNSLIRKFFANQCDEHEFDAVMKYFELHPEQAVKEMGLEEWIATEPVNDRRDGSAAGDLTDGYQAEILQRLKQRLFPKRDSLESPEATFPRVRRFSWTAVAASLLLGAGGWVFIAKKNSQRKSIATVAGPARQQQAKVTWTYRTNTTAGTANIQLPDGSRVKLSAHSSLRYTDSFGASRRDSWLDGAAEFFVKKDKANAFTVFSSSLATTALGTAFAVKTGGREAVKLYSGRVLVRSVHPLKGWHRDIYLSPGQQVVYDDRRLLATVSHFGVTASDAAEKRMYGEDLVFSNSSLKEVFRQLSIQYHKKFTFHAKDLAGLNFTGVVPRTDSLNVFLRLLSGMNNLDIREQPAGYTIGRHKE